MGKLRAALVNALLVVVSVVIFYLVAEIVFFRVLLPDLSLNLRAHLPDRAEFFLQNSKSRYLPRDYIALLGDSYAQGLGDWLLSIAGQNDRPYHSGNILHDLLQRDVVTIGRSGAGSAEAMVQRVTRVWGDDDCYLFPAIEPPARMLMYFYEGNDIDDNFDLIQKQVKPSGDPHQAIDRFLEQDYAVVSAWRCHGHLGDTVFRMSRFLIRQYITGLKQVLDFPVRNQLVIAGKSVGAAILQVPSIGLPPTAFEQGIAVYDRSLAWLRRRFPDVPVTVVYIPSPAATYRYAQPEMVAKDVYVFDADPGKLARPVNDLRFPVSSIYAASQRMCERIRALSLDHGVGFIDTRPALREAGGGRALHGPRDWNHFNEAGYRVLGTTLAQRIGDRAADGCDDRWPGTLHSAR